MPAKETGILAIRLQAVHAAVVPVVIGASLAVSGYDFKYFTLKNQS
jgi:1,4-dihydroxy-2-naphthoate octaprenyltransferase